MYLIVDIGSSSHCLPFPQGLIFLAYDPNKLIVSNPLNILSTRTKDTEPLSLESLIEVSMLLVSYSSYSYP